MLRKARHGGPNVRTVAAILPDDQERAVNFEVNCMNSPAPEREGFRLTSKTFVVPADTSRLDPSLKRKTTSCNLFANHHLPIRDITRILDETYASVVGTLIEFGLVYERRSGPQEPIKVERRNTFFRSL